MMKQIEYEKISIENIENLIKSKYITEVICDADTRTINISEDEFLVLEDAFKEIETKIKVMMNSFSNMFSKMSEFFNSICNEISKILDCKLTKKKFIKLLQSEGMQRNAINEIVKDNKDPYTYKRLYLILNNFK